MSLIMAGVTVGLLLMAAHITSAELVAVTPPAGEIHGNVETGRFDNKEYTYTIFKSIPFAESTGGSNRFQKPVKKPKFETPYKATEMRPFCPQNLNFDPTMNQLARDEDCLHLSIVVPGNVQNARDLPVMIFIYGGGFQLGFQDSYLWPAMAAVNDVICVTLNYRVGFLGFLSNSAKSQLKGNYGLWDQHMAIQWVNDNIAQFGGDTDRITIFGESAGSASVMLQALSMKNEGLFQNVIGQSGTALSAWAYDPHPTHKFNDFVSKTGCHEEEYEDEMIRCLQELSIKELESHAGPYDMFLPSMDGELLVMAPEEILKAEMTEARRIMEFFGTLNVVMGVNSYDGIDDWRSLTDDVVFDINKFDEWVEFGTSMFMKLNEKAKSLFKTTVHHQYVNWTDPWNPHHLRQAVADLYKDYYYISGMFKTAIHHENIGRSGSVFFYEFAHRPSMSPAGEWVKGPIHAEDLSFVLGFPQGLHYVFAKNPVPYTDNDPASVIPQYEMKLSKDMMALWTQIAKYGKPVDMTQWPAFDEYKQRYIVLKANMTSFPVEDHMRASYTNFWNSVVPEIQRTGAMMDDGCGDPPIVASAMAPVSTGLFVFMSVLLVVLNQYIA